MQDFFLDLCAPDKPNKACIRWIVRGDDDLGRPAADRTDGEEPLSLAGDASLWAVQAVVW